MSAYRLRRLYGRNLIQQGTSTAPVYSPWQGIDRMAQAALGGWFMGQQAQPQHPNYQWAQPGNVGPLS